MSSLEYYWVVYSNDELVVRKTGTNEGEEGVGIGVGLETMG